MQAGIPHEALFFCFCYPFRGTSKVDVSDMKDPFVCLFKCGGFIYLDADYKVVAINSFSFDEVGENTTGKKSIVRSTSLFYKEVKEDTSAKKTTLVMNLGRHSPLPETSTEALEAWGRFQPVTVPWLNELGYTEFAWVCPSEILGDLVYPTGGGFAYLNEDLSKSLFVPVALEKVSVRENESFKEHAPEKLRFVRPGGIPNYEPRYVFI